MAHVIVTSLFIIIIVVSSWAVLYYNNLSNKKAEIEESWLQLDSVFKKRNYLINSYLIYISDYIENTIQINKIRKICETLMYSQLNNESIILSLELSGYLKQVFEETEFIIETITNVNFLDIHRQLKIIEDKLHNNIAFYNGSVSSYNNFINKFPNNCASCLFGMKKLNAYEVILIRE